ncbi:MAG: tol-pal system protein YbgF, partial [Alphaproteobacteria bacterium]
DLPLPGTAAELPALGNGGASTATTLTLTPPPPEPAVPMTQAALPPGSVMDQYNYAFGLLRKADYDQAERSLTAFVETYPEDPLAGNSYYWLGQVYSLRGDHERAAVAYLKGYRQYPDGKYAPHSLLKLGVTLGKLNKKIEACASFAELAKKFPDAEAAVKNEAATESGALGCG